MKKVLSPLILHYLRFLARLQLKKIAPDIIGITGSAGKTSGRNAIEAILRDKYSLKVTHRANSESGIPLDILGLHMHNYSLLDWLRVCLLAPMKVITDWKHYDKYIVEMGIDGPFPPKNMGYLLTIVQPRTGILLNAEPMHSQNFDSLTSESDLKKRRFKVKKLIAAEKGRLLKSLPENGLAITYADDPVLTDLVKEVSCPTMLFGADKQADVRVTNIEQKLSGTSFSFEHGGDTGELKLKEYLLPDHFAHTFAAALCIAIDEGMSVQEGCDQLQKHFKLPPGRSSLIPGIKGSLILDSSYNSSARPTIDMLSLVAGLKANRTIGILGDIRELGEEAKLEHEMVVTKALEVCDQLYLVGPQMKKYGLPLALSNKNVRHFPSTKALASFVVTKVAAGDLILVKSSQNTLLLEVVVEALMRRKDKADQLLCRRGVYWDQQRALLAE